MKTELTIEESAKLIELGVDPKLASRTYLDFNGTFAYVGGEEAQDVLDCVDKVFYVEMPVVFSLDDILNILPKEIFYRGLPRPLGMEYSYEVEVWDAYYLGGNHIESAPELIDSLNQLLIWCINNGHYNPKNKEK